MNNDHTILFPCPTSSTIYSYIQLAVVMDCLHILSVKKTNLSKEQDNERRRSNEGLSPGRKEQGIITIDNKPGSSYEIEIVVVLVFLSGSSWLRCRAIK